MAEVARQWQVLQAVQARLQEISVAAGYRTDAGADVRLEASELPVAAARVTLYSGGTTQPDDRNPRQREFTLIVEAVVPATLDDAHHAVVAIAADIEQALDSRLPLPGALPLRFQESLHLDRPEGLPAVAVQLMYRTEFRR